MKKVLISVLAFTLLLASGVTAQNREKNGAREAREGRDVAANGRDRGDAKGAEKGAERAEKGAKESPNNKDAQKDAKEAREAANEAKAKDGKQ